jgi:hypothetical protein
MSEPKYIGSGTLLNPHCLCYIARMNPNILGLAREEKKGFSHGCLLSCSLGP